MPEQYNAKAAEISVKHEETQLRYQPVLSKQIVSLAMHYHELM
jgi:hypothetical protein